MSRVFVTLPLPSPGIDMLKERFEVTVMEAEGILPETLKRHIACIVTTAALAIYGTAALPADKKHCAVRGQYDQGWLAGQRVPAYVDEKDVPKDSMTETYAAVRLGVETRRWAGVPFWNPPPRWPPDQPPAPALPNRHGSGESPNQRDCKCRWITPR